MEALLRSGQLSTVCESALCPNLGECFAAGTATFLIMGDVCTRNCGFCSVRSGRPGKLDEGEPAHVADAASRLGLRHVVITSVSRDDLEDGGASHFVATICAVRAKVPKATIEVLVPDFAGNIESLDAVLAAGPDVLNHNVETVPRLYTRVRPQAVYERSLGVLSRAASSGESLVKTGLMVGLGETQGEVTDLLQQLAGVGAHMVTIGQYLRPSARHLPVVEYVRPEVFAGYARWGEALGLHTYAAPFVRSSYHAGESFAHMKACSERGDSRSVGAENEGRGRG
jgi:lipoyl synthase